MGTIFLLEELLGILDQESKTFEELGAPYIYNTSRALYTDYSKFSTYSCVQIFELMFIDEIFKYLISESNIYAMLCNNKNPDIIVEELKCFCSIHIISVFNFLPGKRHYWEEGKDMKNEMVSNSMRHDRFLQNITIFSLSR